MRLAYSFWAIPSKPQAQLGYLTLSPLPIIDAHQPCVLYSIAVGGGKQNLSIHREQGCGHDQAQALRLLATGLQCLPSVIGSPRYRLPRRASER